MPDHTIPTPEDRFADALDAISLGLAIRHDNDSPLARTAGAIGKIGLRPGGIDEGNPVPLDRATKSRIWADLMAEHGGTSDTAPIPQAPGTAGGTLALNPWVARRETPKPKHSRPSSGVLRFIPSAQPTSTFLLMIAVLALVGGIFASLAPDGGQGIFPTALATEDSAQFADASPEASPVSSAISSGLCIGQRAGMSEADLLDASMEDWPPPSYRYPWRAEPEVEAAIRDTYISFHQCLIVPHLDPDTEVPEEASSYFSDRARFTMRYDDLSPEQQAEIDTFTCLDRGRRVLDAFPLPINVVARDMTVPTTNPPPPDWESPLDEIPVYQLGDGRYGMILGAVSSAVLADPSMATEGDWLTFVAFVEVDGRYYIDEDFTVIARTWDDATPMPAGNGCDGSG